MLYHQLRSPTIICYAAAFTFISQTAAFTQPALRTNNHILSKSSSSSSSKTDNEFDSPRDDVFDLNIIQPDHIEALSTSIISPAATAFVDIESEYDDLSISDETSITQHLAADLEDEDRILTEREDRLFLTNSNIKKIETCVLIGVEDVSALRRNKKEARRSDDVDFTLDFSLEESMIEMRELIKTAGLDLRGEITQRLQEVNPRTYIGTGKVVEVQTLLGELNTKLEREGLPPCCTVVFDAELTPGQQKALENAFNKKVIENDFLGSETGVINVIGKWGYLMFMRLQICTCCTVEV